MSVRDELVFMHSAYNPECSAVVDKYFLDYITLQFSVNGGLELFYDDKRYELSAGAAWFCYPGPHTRFHLLPANKSWNHCYCAFKGSLAFRWRSLGLVSEEPRYPADMQAFSRKFHTLLETLSDVKPWGRLRAANILESLLIDLAESCSQTVAAPQWLEKTFEILDSYEGFTPDYSQVARQVAMGESTLRRKFKHTVGMSLHNYFLQRRLARAQSMLGESDLPLSAIAHELGYQDVYFFSRQFKKLSGVSPANYRRARQK